MVGTPDQVRLTMEFPDFIWFFVSKTKEILKLGGSDISMNHNDGEYVIEFHRPVSVSGLEFVNGIRYFIMSLGFVPMDIKKGDGNDEYLIFENNDGMGITLVYGHEDNNYNIKKIIISDVGVSEMTKKISELLEEFDIHYRYYVEPSTEIIKVRAELVNMCKNTSFTFRYDSCTEIVFPKWENGIPKSIEVVQQCGDGGGDSTYKYVEVNGDVEVEYYNGYLTIKVYR
jgi:hypothetical protein